MLKLGKDDIKPNFRWMAQRHCKIFPNFLRFLKALYQIDQLPKHFQQISKEEIWVQVYPNTRFKSTKNWWAWSDDFK
jgi:hypothetical protein